MYVFSIVSDARRYSRVKFILIRTRIIARRKQKEKSSFFMPPRGKKIITRILKNEKFEKFSCFASSLRIFFFLLFSFRKVYQHLPGNFEFEIRFFSFYIFYAILFVEFRKYRMGLIREFSIKIPKMKRKIIFSDRE